MNLPLKMSDIIPSLILSIEEAADVTSMMFLSLITVSQSSSMNTESVLPIRKDVNSGEARFSAIEGGIRT